MHDPDETQTFCDVGIRNEFEIDGNLIEPMENNNSGGAQLRTKKMLQTPYKTKTFGDVDIRNIFEIAAYPIKPMAIEHFLTCSAQNKENVAKPL